MPEQHDVGVSARKSHVTICNTILCHSTTATWLWDDLNHDLTVCSLSQTLPAHAECDAYRGAISDFVWHCHTEYGCIHKWDFLKIGDPKVMVGSLLWLIKDENRGSPMAWDSHGVVSIPSSLASLRGLPGQEHVSEKVAQQDSGIGTPWCWVGFHSRSFEVGEFSAVGCHLALKLTFLILGSPVIVVAQTFFTGWGRVFDGQVNI